MTRWKAAGSHFALSILVIGGIATTALLLWYPHSLYKVAGLDRILLVMFGIDLTAGPLLTLILYRPGKWGLKFDLWVVALAQLAFLGYGLHTLWDGRPVFLVGTPDTFTVVFASEISPEDLELAPKPEWRRLSWAGPQLVATKMPEDPEERQHVVDEFMSGGAGIERSPKYYRNLAELSNEIIAGSQPIHTLAAPQYFGSLPARLPADELRWLPVVSRRGEGVMLIRASDGAPVEVLGPP